MSISEFENLKQHTCNCYSPYSKINVVSMLTSFTNKTFIGVNIENASYGLTICAERSAFCKAISSGIKKHNFKNLYLYTDSFDTIVPCGACLQFMSEFVSSPFKVVTMGKSNIVRTYTIKELLPHSFNI